MSITIDRIDEQSFLNFLEFYKLYHEESELTIELSTFGGDIEISMMIADILTRHKGKTIANIQNYALYDSVIIALACKEIRMGSFTFLGSLSIKHQKHISHIKKILNRIYKEEDVENIFEIFSNDQTVYITLENLPVCIKGEKLKKPRENKKIELNPEEEFITLDTSDISRFKKSTKGHHASSKTSKRFENKY